MLEDMRVVSAQAEVVEPTRERVLEVLSTLWPHVYAVFILGTEDEWIRRANGHVPAEECVNNSCQ